MAPMERNKTRNNKILNLRLSEDDHAKITALAVAEDRSNADMARLLFRRAFEAQWPVVKPTPQFKPGDRVRFCDVPTIKGVVHEVSGAIVAVMSPNNGHKAVGLASGWELDPDHQPELNWNPDTPTPPDPFPEDRQHPDAFYGKALNYQVQSVEATAGGADLIKFMDGVQSKLDHHADEIDNSPAPRIKSVKEAFKNSVPLTADDTPIHPVAVIASPCFDPELSTHYITRGRNNKVYALTKKEYERLATDSVTRMYPFRSVVSPSVEEAVRWGEENLPDWNKVVKS